MYCNRYTKQRGSGLMIVLFVIVVMGLMAIAMTKIGASSQTMTTKEVLGTRAWFSAYSANEVLLTKLFPLGDPLISKPMACKKYFDVDIKMMMPPLQQGCKIISMNCVPVIINKTNEYKLLSTATCGSGKVTMTRTQEVWAKGLK
ncbi:MshP protein [Photobacterium carnosum]|uniref:MshP protein n=1 Tax=Photobacterium carnosum TaxID=2023717 RepID=UPI001E3ED009|nr:MshP protein [Photobacterium carnosum]MCD9494799.1 MshP protein [Photobacterium carnosum]MCD9522468.1 MshP protein [Photobacterium carnosum]